MMFTAKCPRYSSPQAPRRQNTFLVSPTPLHDHHVPRHGDWHLLLLSLHGCSHKFDCLYLSFHRKCDREGAGESYSCWLTTHGPFPSLSLSLPTFGHLQRLHCPCVSVASVPWGCTAGWPVGPGIHLGGPKLQRVLDGQQPRWDKADHSLSSP